MKKTLLLLLGSLICSVTIAQTIDVDQARNLAKQFMGEETRAGNARELTLSHTFVSLQHPEENNLYVFNQGENGGFVVVAADERVAYPVLGYSEEGSFDFDEAPENMRWWLSEYVRQIDFLRDNVAEGSVAPTTRSETRAATIAVAPLLGDIKWDQYKPYNNLCPSDCPSGCVATAMAQIMYFHRWPLVGRGSHTNNANKTPYTVNFYQSHYQWDKMLDTYTGSYTDEQAEAVAKLMYDCGIAVDMQYAKDGSGALSECVPEAMVKYFGYSDDCTRVVRDQHPEGWDERIAAELEAHRPVYYSGHGADGGHAFVADGYYVENGRHYFHINWGWSGQGNSWFQSTSLQMTHEAHFYEFTDSHAIVTGIYANSRTKVGGLYYNVLNDNRASVSYPDKEAEYSGNIVIPSSVKINGMDYVVDRIGPAAFSGCTGITSVSLPAGITSIGGNAFYGCTNMKSLEVAWTEDIPYCLFDEDFTENVVLVVPEGALETFDAAYPWSLFSSKRDKAGKTITYGAWQTFETGVGNFEYSQFESGTQKNMEIVCRTSSEASNKHQMKIMHWLKDEAPYLFFTYDSESQKCVVPVQRFGYWVSYTYKNEKGERVTASDEVVVSDVPSYDEDENYRRFPCKYDPVAGVFTLSLAYFVTGGSFGEGPEYFRLQGEQYKDFSLSIGDAKSIIEKDDRTATQKIDLVGGDDVVKFSYAVAEGVLSDSLVEDLAKKIADGTIESKVKKKGLMNLVTVTYPAPGMYTVVAISQDAEGNYYGNYASRTANFMYSKDWKSVGKAHYTEDLLAGLFSDVDTCSYEVEVEQHITEPGRFRMKNPYEIFAKDKDLGTVTNESDCYVEINATDPDGVYIPHGQSMNLTLGDYGDLLVSSIASYAYIDEGKTVAEKKAEGYCGTFKDGVITFPSKEYDEDELLESDEEDDPFHGVLLVCIPGYDTETWFYTGRYFRLDMSALELTPVSPIRKDAEGAADIFDLQGRKLPQKDKQKLKGLYIIGGKKILK